MYFTLYFYNKVSQRKGIKIIRKRKYIYTTYTCVYQKPMYKRRSSINCGQQSPQGLRILVWFTAVSLIPTVTSSPDKAHGISSVTEFTR